MALVSRLLECVIKNISIISITPRIHIILQNTSFEWLHLRILTEYRIIMESSRYPDFCPKALLYP